jgi:hypothetical protein
MKTSHPISLKTRAETEFCIAVEEEFGYKLHIWFPPFSQEELESRWRETPSCGMKGLFAALGGDWINIDEAPDGSAAALEGPEIYARLDDPSRYTAHICCDQDSHLITPDGRVLVHGGFDWDSASGTDTDPAMIERPSAQSTVQD